MKSVGGVLTALFVCLQCVAVRAQSESAAIGLTTINVPMRDGVMLATDIYRAANLPLGPVALMRTPYNKERAKPTAERFAKSGYVVVVQDCRGRFESEGNFIPYDNEGQDGFDCVEWVYRQSWCNGRIGMWGSSYVGATQWQAAVEHPPGLVAITPTATWSSFYRNLYLGGAVRLSLITRWAAGNSPKPADAVANSDWNAILAHLPLSEVDREIGWSVPWLRGMLTHPAQSGYWRRLDLSDEILKLEIPVQHIVGYYDFFSRESVNTFVQMRSRAHNESTRLQQQLILGPWDHGTIGMSKVGEVDFGPQAVWDAAAANLKWLDRFVKNDPTASTEPSAAVQYFVMGENAWRESENWPPSGYSPTAFYLHSNGNAATRHGDGRLNQTHPSGEEPVDYFRADPADPTPACPITSERPLNAATWAPVDQRPLEDRSDVLVYRSEPLTESLTFAGDARAELFVASDTPDADWVVKLIDVHPDGFAQNLAVGILRGSFRESEWRSLPLEPGTTYKIAVDLGPIAARLAKGHCLQVDICGSYFPLFDRNPNTAEGPFSKRTAVATESVFHSRNAASCIILPISP